MPSDIHILIPDAALRDAVVEQIAVAKIGTVRVAENAQNLAKQAEAQNPCVIVVGDGAYDKKTAAALLAMPERPAVLLLGDNENAEQATESFAKPFRLGHLLARLRYYLETAPLLRDRVIEFGDYRLEPQNRRIIDVRKDEPIRLTEKETALLVFLADSTEPATRRDILAGVWGYDERIDTHTLETHIYQLRRKLDRDAENWLINEAGAYRLARGVA